MQLLEIRLQLRNIAVFHLLEIGGGRSSPISNVRRNYGNSQGQFSVLLGSNKFVPDAAQIRWLKEPNKFSEYLL